MSRLFLHLDTTGFSPSLGHLRLPVAPPSPDGIDVDSQNTEEFPAFMDISGLENTSHCIVHCHQLVCKRIAVSHTAPGCSCILPSPSRQQFQDDSVSYLSVNPNSLREGETILRTLGPDKLITIYPEDAKSIASRLKTFILGETHRYDNFARDLDRLYPGSGLAEASALFNGFLGIIETWATRTTHPVGPRTISFGRLVNEFFVLLWTMVQDYIDLYEIEYPPEKRTWPGPNLDFSMDNPEKLGTGENGDGFDIHTNSTAVGYGARFWRQGVFDVLSLLVYRSAELEISQHGGAYIKPLSLILPGHERSVL